MSNTLIAGRITFIHYEKQRAVIEYLDHGKKKTIQGDIAEEKKPDPSKRKKNHRFLQGDEVSFEIKKTGANGRIHFASNIQYRFNSLLENLINKSKTENKFLGYIKSTGHEYFIKEIDTYLFFPLRISAYEIPPSENEMQQPVYFKLENTHQPEKIAAALYNHSYIPEFLTAVQHFKKQTVLQAIVKKITPYGIYLDLFNGKIEAKIPVDKSYTERIEKGSIIPGTAIPVKFRHISPDKIVLEETA